MQSEEVSGLKMDTRRVRRGDGKLLGNSNFGIGGWSWYMWVHPKVIRFQLRAKEMMRERQELPQEEHKKPADLKMSSVHVRETDAIICYEDGSAELLDLCSGQTGPQEEVAHFVEDEILMLRLVG